jgi:hypothetical protein
MTSARLRTWMSEVVKTEPTKVGSKTLHKVTLSCGHQLLVREKTHRPERRCPACKHAREAES